MFTPRRNGSDQSELPEILKSSCFLKPVMAVLSAVLQFERTITVPLEGSRILKVVLFHPGRHVTRKQKYKIQHLQSETIYTGVLHKVWRLVVVDGHSGLRRFRMNVSSTVLQEPFSGDMTSNLRGVDGPPHILLWCV